jgi:hypothetical protein
MSDFSSQAGLASFSRFEPPSESERAHARGLLHGAQRPVRVYGAVIEWPEPLVDASPALILARTRGERDEKIREKIREIAYALTDPGWRDAIDATSDNWHAWLPEFEYTPCGQPWVTEYEQEV